MNESKWRIRGNVYLQDSIKEWRQLKEQLAISYYPMRNHKPLKKTTLSSNLHKYYHMNANCFTNKASSAEYSTFLLHHVQALQYCSAVTIQDYIWWINWQRYETFPVCGCRNESICCFSLSFIRWSEYFGVLDMINFTASHWAPGNCDRQSVLNFSLQKPWGFFFLLLHSKKKKKKVMCVTVIFFFMCQTRWKKKNSSWKLYFSQKKMFCVRHLFHVLFQWNDFLFWLKCFFLQCSFWPQEAEVHHRSAVSVTGGLLCFIGLFINVCQQWTVNHCNWEEGEESAYFWHRKRVVCFWDGGWRTRSNSSVPSALRMSATAVFLCLQRSHWLLHVSKLCMTISGDHQPGTSLENGSLRRKHYLF